MNFAGWTPEQLQAFLRGLDTAIFTGATRVSYDGRSVDYTSQAELIRAKNQVLAALGVGAPSRRTVAAYNSGF